MKKQLTQNLPLVAIELGSHSVRAMAAKRIDHDTLQILGYEQSTKYSSIEQGVVINTSNTGFMINETLKLLSNRIGVSNLPTAFVLMGGMTMQSAIVGSKRNLIRPGEITAALLKECEQECKQKIETKYPSVTVFGLVPVCYILDGKQQDELPTSHQRAKQFEVFYTAFVGQKELETKLVDSFNRATKSVEQAFPRPEALLSVFAAEDSSVLEQGCAVIDLGAHTTTLSIFRDNQYLLNHVISAGGDDITHCLNRFGINFDEAEKIKCGEINHNRIEIVAAAPEFLDRIYSMRFGEQTFTNVDMSTAIRQELDKILTPLLDMVAQYPVHTIFLTGGASQLKGIDQYLQQKTDIPVMYGSHACLLDGDTPDEFYSPEYSSLIGALILGSDYREAHPAEAVRKPSFLEQFVEKTGTLFTDENNY